MRPAVKTSLALLLLTVAPVLAAQSSDPEILIEKEHYKQAVRLLEQRLRGNANDVKAIELLAKVKLEARRSDEVITMIEPLVAQSPNNADLRILLADAYGQKAGSEDLGMFEKFRWARNMKKQGDVALSLNPKHLDALDGMMQFHAEAPGIVGGDRRKAHEYAGRLTALDPVRGNLAEADLSVQEGREDQAEDYYRKALAANPRSYVALSALGKFYADEKHRNYEKSDRYLRQAIDSDPAREAAYTLLAGTLAERQKWVELDQLLARAEKGCPDDLNYYYQAAHVLLINGKDNARAERYFRKYLTQAPEFRRPTWAHAHWHLGLLLEREGKKNEAREEIQTALKLNPELKAAEKDLKRIKS